MGNGQLAAFLPVIASIVLAYWASVLTQGCVHLHGEGACSRTFLCDVFSLIPFVYVTFSSYLATETCNVTIA